MQDIDKAQGGRRDESKAIRGKQDSVVTEETPRGPLKSQALGDSCRVYAGDSIGSSSLGLALRCLFLC